MSASQMINWSIQQIAILARFAGDMATSLVVRARAGCGKTTTIVEGIRRYVAARGPKVRVLATSFATKITEELKSRLADLPSVDVKGLHSLGNYYIGRKVGYKQVDHSRKFDIARTVEPQAPQCVIKLLAELHTLAREQMPWAKSGTDIAPLALEFEIVCDEDCVKAGWTDDGLCEAAYDCMLYAATNYRKIDFADMIYLPLRNGWAFPLYDLIVVDETQDMTVAQLDLAMRASKLDTGRFCIVGDDQQAIFEFRGADVNGLDRLKSKLNADELGLTVTRRCPKSHVKIAQEIVPDFTAADDAPDGIVTTNYAKDDMLAMALPGDFILSRTNAPLVPLCLNYLKRNIRAYVAGKKFGATLAAIVRKMKCGNDLSTLKSRLSAWFDLEATKLQNDKRAQDEKWLKNATELLSDKVECIVAMADGMVTEQELIGRINALCQDSKDVTVKSIMLSTVHKAKGLETDTTWILDGTFQYRSDEDSRVRYVALTRSRNAMHLVQYPTKEIAE